jgi:putative methyltransferase
MIGSYCLEQPEISESLNIEYRFLRQDGKTLADSMEDPVIVGFSCYVWNFRGSLAVAMEVKRRYPNAIIVLGGFSIPKLPSKIDNFYREHPYIDVLVHGEGELTFASLLREFIGNKSYHDIQGVTFKTLDVEAGFISNPNANRIESLDDLPSPYLNGTFDEMIKRYGAKITGALWETNRGCPYSCTFCDWGNADVNKIKKYDLGRLREEIKWISNNDFYYMFFSDANFGIFAERDMEIAGYIADCHAKNGSPHHVITNWAKNKSEAVVAIAERLARGGVANNITMAVQSTNPETLKVIKRKNLHKGKIDTLKTLFHDKHIPTYVEIILALPLETYDTFAKGLNTILSNRLEDRFFVYLCQMLENTELDSPESREEYQLETRQCRHTVSNRKFEWSDEDVEYEEFVVGTSTMPILDWRRAYNLGYFLTALYNHRAAFFPLIYLRENHGVLPVDMLEFIIAEIATNPGEYPIMERSFGVIDNQAQLMINGESSMSGLPEAEGLVVLPHVGSLAMLAYDKESFFDELAAFCQLYFSAYDLPVDMVVFDEVMTFQKLSFQGWPQQPVVHHVFTTNVQEYFRCLTLGLDAPEIKAEPTMVTFSDHARKVETFAEFAATLVRGGLTVDLLKAEVGEGQDYDENDELAKIRWEMEQRNLDKLKSEFEKLES